MITTRLRGVDGPKVQLWTLTGEGYNAAYEILKQRQNADGDSIGLDIDVVRGSVLENPYLSQGEIDRFRRRYEGTGKEEQALHGGFAAAEGLVYEEFRRDTHLLTAAEADSRALEDWRIYGYDAGWNDPRVLLEIGKTPLDQLVVLDEFHQSGTHVDAVIHWLQDREKPKGTVYAEHEPADIEKLRGTGWDVEKAEKSIDAGISEVRRRLGADRNQATTDRVSSGSDAFIITPTAGGGRTRGETADDEEDPPAPRVGLLVANRCRRTIRDVLGYKEEHVGTPRAEDHCLDSLRYAVMGVMAPGTGLRSPNVTRPY